jgi:hypothetical protein
VGWRARLLQLPATAGGGAGVEIRRRPQPLGSGQRHNEDLGLPNDRKEFGDSILVSNAALGVRSPSAAPREGLALDMDINARA